MKKTLATGALALALLSCDSVPLDKRTYIGHLPIYGASKLTVYTVKGSDEIVCAEFSADLLNHGFQPTRACDYTRDGRLNFDMVDIPDGMDGTRMAYPGWKDFPEAERVVSFAVNRLDRLREIKEQ